MTDQRSELDGARGIGDLTVGDSENHEIETRSVEPASEGTLEPGQCCYESATYSPIADNGATTERPGLRSMTRHSLRLCRGSCLTEGDRVVVTVPVAAVHPGNVALGDPAHRVDDAIDIRKVVAEPEADAHHSR